MFCKVKNFTMYEDDFVDSRIKDEKLNRVSTVYDQRMLRKMNLTNIMNLVTSVDLYKFPEAINKLIQYFKLNGPIHDEVPRTLFFDRLRLEFNVSDPLIPEILADAQLRNTAFECLCWYGYCDNPSYPRMPDLNLDEYFQMLKSGNIDNINAALGLFTGLIVFPDVHDYLLQNNILDIVLQYDNRTLTPIFIRKLIRLWTKHKEQFKTHKLELLSRLIPYIYQFLDSPYSLAKNNTLRLLLTLEKNNFEVDPNQIISRFHSFIEEKNEDIINSAIRYVPKIQNLSDSIFDDLISISTINEKVGKVIFKFLKKNIEVLSPNNLQKLIAALLESVLNGSASLGQYALPLLTGLMENVEIDDERLPEAFMRFAEDQSSCLCALSGLMKYISMNQNKSNMENILEVINENTDLLNDLTTSENEEIAHISTSLLELLEK